MTMIFGNDVVAQLPPQWPGPTAPPIIGVEIGQKRQASAIAVVEMVTRPEGTTWPYRKRNHWNVHHLEMLPPGTTYPGLARRLAEVCESILKVGDRKRNRKPLVYANATGLGAPVIGVLRAEASQARKIMAVHFNHGDRRTEEPLEKVVILGKGYLVSRLQALLQAGQLHLSKTPAADTLARELGEYEIRIAQDANERYGAFRVGTQDHLVNALGLAVQIDWRPTAFISYLR